MTKTVPSGTPVATYEVNATATSSDLTSTGSGTANCTVAPGLPPLTAAIAPLTTYPRNSTISIVATVRRTDSTPVAGASVLFTLNPPPGSPVTRTVLTDSTGRATWSYKIAAKAVTGTYTVTAVATLGNETATAAPETFIVSP